MNDRDLQQMVRAMVKEESREIGKQYSRQALGANPDDRRLDCPDCSSCLGLMDNSGEVTTGYQGHRAMFRPDGRFALDCKRCKRTYFFGTDGLHTGDRQRLTV